MATFRLRFAESDIPYWASRYSYPTASQIERCVAPAARARGYLTREEFLAICRWKSPRSHPKCAQNRPRLVKEVTRVALAARDEEMKIKVLLLLSGVSWPTASVILHFCDRDRYPILDYRALWSSGLSRSPAYTFGFWQKYCVFVRGLSTPTDHPMQTIDRALWQYSKKLQSP